jgi:arginase family enzyme
MTDVPDLARLLRDVTQASFEADPLPGWAGPGTLFGAPAVALDAVSASGWAVAGVPFDGTASSRPGAAEGPRAIRTASLVFANSLRSMGEWQMLDTRTGRTFHYAAPPIVDVGDLHVYPTDTVRTVQAVATEAAALAERAERLLFLNGDHSCTFPTFAGYRAARLAAQPGHRVGFINIDHHFDYGNWSALHGALYHGSNSRRISELPGMLPCDIAFVGVGDVTRYEQFSKLVDEGYHVVPGASIRRAGAAAALAGVVAELAERCDSVYVSLDIDVLDTSAASGTGHVTMGGIQVGELFDVFEVLRELPVGAMDVAEVAPRYDPTGATAQIAARLLFEFLFRAGTGGPVLAPWMASPGESGPYQPANYSGQLLTR